MMSGPARACGRPAAPYLLVGTSAAPVEAGAVARLVAEAPPLLTASGEFLFGGAGAPRRGGGGGVGGGLPGVGDELPSVPPPECVAGGPPPSPEAPPPGVAPAALREVAAPSPLPAESEPDRPGPVERDSPEPE